MSDVYINDINAYFKHSIQNLTLYFFRMKHDKTLFSLTEFSVDTSVLFSKRVTHTLLWGRKPLGFCFLIIQQLDQRSLELEIGSLSSVLQTWSGI